LNHYFFYYFWIKYLKKISIMKKQLLLGTFLLGSLFAANAQDSCATAVAVTSGSTTTVGTINGTYEGSCWEGETVDLPASEWYSFTPATNAVVRINTNLPANVAPFSDDTKVSVFTGTCTALTCYTASDDVSGANFLTDFSFNAAAGTTYYIAFDNAYTDAGFQFQLTSTPTSCFTPFGFQFVVEPTTTATTIGWSAPTIGTPTGYQFEYGAPGFELGTGTLQTLTTPQAELSGLTGSTDYEFYVRTFCGGTDYSEWVGPISFNTVFEAADLDYSYGFETINSLGGWSTMNINAQAGGAGFQPIAAEEGFTPQEGDFALAAGAVSTASDAWLFSRPVNLAAGEVVTMTFYAKELVGAGNGGVNNLRLTVGNIASPTAQTTNLWTYNDINNTEWASRTVVFTAPSANEYVFGFNYTSPAQAQANFGFLVIDNVIMDSNLGTESVLASQFAVYPNPAVNVLNITNAENILVNNVSIVDLNGRTVKSVKFDGVSEAQVNISDLSAGMYLVNISSDKGITTKKIVKN
jgi:hypothetical protein